MKTLTIKDLAIACELDHDGMARVRGGHNSSSYNTGSYKMGGYGMGSGMGQSYPMFSMPSTTTTVNATQSLAQVQNVLNETADGSAFVSGVTANNNTSQFGQNNLLVL